MKFTVSSSSLLKQLQALGGIISTSTALPILDCFLFELNKAELKLSASDLENALSVSIKVDSKDTGLIAVPARLLTDTLKTFPDQPLSFNIDDKTKSIEISSNFGKYKLTGHDAMDFPKLPEIESPS